MVGGALEEEGGGKGGVVEAEIAHFHERGGAVGVMDWKPWRYFHVSIILRSCLKATTENGGSENGGSENGESKDGESDEEELDKRGVSPSILPTPTSVSVQLGNKTFAIDRGIPASARRAMYFQKNQGKLSKDERKVLTAIGMDAEMEERLKAYLPKFFDVLPDCQTDTNLYLSKQCEIPFFVIWSTKFGERHLTNTRIEESRKSTTIRSGYDTAIDQDIVEGMSTKLSDIDQIFTLIRMYRVPQEE